MCSDTLKKAVGRRIRLYRLERRWSQEVLGELSGLNRSYIGAVERGEHNMGLDNLERIAGALEVEPVQLLTGSFSFQE